MILMHHDWDAWVEFHGSEHQVAQVGVLGIRSGASGSLDDYRRIRLLGRFHNRLDLFHIVDIECCDSVVVFGRMVQDFSKGYQSHFGAPRRVRGSLERGCNS